MKDIGKALKITPTIIRDKELEKQGFGGIYGVGKAAKVPPALAVLSYTPEGATQTIAWVGKGIVYDTGGLSLKGKVSYIFKFLRTRKNECFVEDGHARHETRLWRSRRSFGSVLCCCTVRFF